MSKFLHNDELESAITRLKKDFNVMAPVYEHFGGRFAHTDNLVYKQVDSYDQIVWTEKSHFSPKEVIFPITETLFWFNHQELKESTIDPRPTLVFLRTCDINALKSLDYMFLKNGGNPDFYYQRLRKKLTLVLIECHESFEHCFCVSMNANTTDNFSASFHFSNDGAAIYFQDETLAPYFEDLGQASNHRPQFVTHNPVSVTTPDKVCHDPAKIREILLHNVVWDEYDSRCIGCGRCTTSCPTCTCFSVYDVSYNQAQGVGERRRQQASCMVGNFTDMAGGHQFRKKTGERLRYRALHKVNDFKAIEGQDHMCVGCGRCVDRCPQYIAFSKVINKMTECVANTIAQEKIDV